MPGAKYFLSITGAFLVGVLSLLAAIGIVFFFWDAISDFITMALPFIAGSLVTLAAVVIVWVLVYFFAMLGVGIYYAILHPMTVNMSPDADYGIERSTEAGKREKGRSRTVTRRKPAAKPRKKPSRKSPRKK